MACLQLQKTGRLFLTPLQAFPAAGVEGTAVSLSGFTVSLQRQFLKIDFLIRIGLWDAGQQHPGVGMRRAPENGGRSI